MKSLALITALFILGWSLSAGPAQKGEDKKDQKDKKESAPLKIKLNVIVLDATGTEIRDLPQDRFRVLEDDLPQTVSLFQQKERPKKYVLAIDTSLSLRNKIMVIIEAAKLVILSSPAGAEVEIMRFISSDKIKTEQGFTADKARLLKAIDNLYLEGGQSAIIDAVYLANEELEKNTKDDANNRRALVLITDGEERYSYYTLVKLLAGLHQTGLQVFAIGFPWETKNPAKAEGFLNRLAQETGGAAYYPESAAELPLIAKQIELEMAAGYVVGYDSARPRDGRSHKVKIDMIQSDGSKVLAFTRANYTAPRN